MPMIRTQATRTEIKEQLKEAISQGFTDTWSLVDQFGVSFDTMRNWLRLSGLLHQGSHSMNDLHDLQSTARYRIRNRKRAPTLGCETRALKEGACYSRTRCYRRDGVCGFRTCKICEVNH
jgi:hypothetical protein